MTHTQLLVSQERNLRNRIVTTRLEADAYIDDINQIDE